MDPARRMVSFPCAQNPQKVRVSPFRVQFAIDPRKSVVEVNAEDLTIRHGKSGQYLAYPLGHVRAVVNLERPGARHLGTEGPHPLRRGPCIGYLVRGSRDTIMTLFPATERFSTVAVVFTEPSWAPPKATLSHQPGVLLDGPTVLIDALYLDVQDASALVHALAARGVPIAATVGEVLAMTMGTVEEPAAAEALSAARRRGRLRFGWLSMSPWLAAFVGGPAIACVAMAVQGRWVWSPVLLGFSALTLRSLWGRVHQASDST